MDDYVIQKQMDDLRRRLVDAVKVRGIVEYSELSAAIGRNQTYVQQFVTRRSPKRLFEDQVRTIEAVLERREAEAVGRADGPGPSDGQKGEQNAKLLVLFSEALKAPPEVQKQIAHFIESRLGEEASKSRQMATKQAS